MAIRMIIVTYIRLRVTVVCYFFRECAIDLQKAHLQQTV